MFSYVIPTTNSQYKVCIHLLRGCDGCRYVFLARLDVMYHDVALHFNGSDNGSRSDCSLAFPQKGRCLARIYPCEH
jgi:hypothetical protein